MAMKLVKKTDEYTIYQRGDKRYAVQDANKKAVNGEEKARILVAEDLIKVTLPAPAAPEEEAAPEAEAAAEEAPAAKEAPAAEEPAAVEEPAADEQAVEEPAAAEEPAVEEPAAEDK